MCGIVGIIGEENVTPYLLKGLERLEYRGYDSAGLATLEQGKLSRVRVAGRINKLAEQLDKTPLGGTIGIGHTRWATHGAPSENNAHPHFAKCQSPNQTPGGQHSKVAIVHNGIIENWQKLKAEMPDANLTSDTDSELIAHLLARHLVKKGSEDEAVLATINQLQGSFACAILIENENQRKLYGVSRGSPLAVCRGQGKQALVSDGLAATDWAEQITYMHDGDVVVLSENSSRWFGFDGKPLSSERSFQPFNVEQAQVSKGAYESFMRKEMEEHPLALEAALKHYVQGERLAFPALPNQQSIRNVLMIGCGGSLHAAQTARYWLEKYAELPAHEEIASEFRDRHAVIPQDTLLLFISQSGETADTLAAFRHCERQGHASVAIVNQAHSTLARSADLSLMMMAGTEVGVAATKSLTSQMAVLALIVLQLAKMPNAQKQKHIQALKQLPDKMRSVLRYETHFEKIAQAFLQNAHYILHLGRGAFYPIALEGALKMKEISYIPSEGYAAGEMKHGPIAMIDERTPVVAFAPYNDIFPKTLSNLQETHARGGKLILISDKRGLAEAGDLPVASVELPDCDDFTAPILYVLAAQFLAYHTARLKGLDVDRPRNLAKSVTVE